jgi:glutamate-5-semialdehyde dehydrogenase
MPDRRAPRHLEAIPEVIVDITALISGIAAILKGGKEPVHKAAELVHDPSRSCALPAAFLQAVETRAEVATLPFQGRYVDLVTPCGSQC